MPERTPSRSRTRRFMLRVAGVLLPLAAMAGPVSFVQADDETAEAAERAVRRATDFLRGISTNGGYVGIYSKDLSERFGEALYEEARETQIWVQPPGTPSVRQVREGDRDAILADRRAEPSAEAYARRAERLSSRVERIVDEQDDEGRWIGDDDRLHIGTFVSHINTLAAYLHARSAASE